MWSELGRAKMPGKEWRHFVRNENLSLNIGNWQMFAEMDAAVQIARGVREAANAGVGARTTQGFRLAPGRQVCKTIRSL